MEEILKYTFISTFTSDFLAILQSQWIQIYEKDINGLQTKDKVYEEVKSYLIQNDSFTDLYQNDVISKIHSLYIDNFQKIIPNADASLNINEYLIRAKRVAYTNLSLSDPNHEDNKNEYLMKNYVLSTLVKDKLTLYHNQILIDNLVSNDSNDSNDSNNSNNSNDLSNQRHRPQQLRIDESQAQKEQMEQIKSAKIRSKPRANRKKQSSQLLDLDENNVVNLSNEQHYNYDNYDYDFDF